MCQIKEINSLVWDVVYKPRVTGLAGSVSLYGSCLLPTQLSAGSAMNGRHGADVSL